MPRGQRKRGEFDFIVWLDDGARIQFKTTKSVGNSGIADEIRRYLVPLMQRIEEAQTVGAEDRKPRVNPA